MGPVYDGIGHLMLSPEDLLPVVALSLFCALRGKDACRFCLFMLPVFWLGGGLSGLQAPSLAIPDLAALSFVILGLMVAADLRVPVWLFGLLVMLFGLLHGFHNGIALHGGPGFYGLLGITAALFVVVALVSAVVVSLRPPWTRIVVRVAGSWVAAVGILMVGWRLSGQA
jgi:hydrogenase/urease accessory protein HupE